VAILGVDTCSHHVHNHAMKIVTRQDALTHGLSRYFTGKPCKHGHLSERWTLNGACAECIRVNQDRTRATFRALRQAM
jgi:hypothetical protein